jgi:hypothetical protein
MMLFRQLLFTTTWVQCVCIWSVFGFQQHLHVRYSFDGKKNSLRRRTYCCRAVNGQQPPPLQPPLVDDKNFRRLTMSSRKDFLLTTTTTIGMNSFVVGTILTGFPYSSHAKSYSENARNLERINAGDFSGMYISSQSQVTKNKKETSYIIITTQVG